MKVKVIKECWFEERHINPDIEENVIVEYPCEDETKLPTWAEPINGKKEVAAKKANKEEADGKNEAKQKVKDLPVAEKNLLLEKAAKVGINGNQIMSWNVTTLEAKIAEQEAKLAANKEADGKDGEGKDE